MDRRIGRRRPGSIPPRSPATGQQTTPPAARLFLRLLGCYRWRSGRPTRPVALLCVGGCRGSPRPALLLFWVHYPAADCCETASARLGLIMFVVFQAAACGALWADARLAADVMVLLMLAWLPG